MHNYHSANGVLPAAYLSDRFGRPNDSWRTAILPYLEQTSIFNQLNFHVSWDSAENQTVRLTRIATFLRPEEADEAGPPIVKFLAVVGQQTPFPGPLNTTFEQATDGLSNTIMVGEVAESDIGWAEPRDLPFLGMDLRVGGPCKKMGFGSPYGDPRILLMDGSIKTLKRSTQPGVLRALLTSHGNESLEGEGTDWTLGPALKVQSKPLPPEAKP